jgi:hypothetical protein
MCRLSPRGNLIPIGPMDNQGSCSFSMCLRSGSYQLEISTYSVLRQAQCPLLVVGIAYPSAMVRELEERAVCTLQQTTGLNVLT